MYATLSSLGGFQVYLGPDWATSKFFLVAHLFVNWYEFLIRFEHNFQMMEEVKDSIFAALFA